MFTPESLQNLADEQMVIADMNRAVDLPNGERDLSHWQTVGYHAYMLSKRAEFASKYMLAHGIKEARQIGSFGNLPVKQGQKVRILKGAPLHTMGATTAERAHKEIHGCHRFAKRTYVVTVSQNFEGWNTDNEYDMMREKYIRENMRQQTIEWAGTGGYWTWTSPEYVEII
jgi:hypothetical protein